MNTPSPRLTWLGTGLCATIALALGASPAQADELALSFDLKPVAQTQSNSVESSSIADSTAEESAPVYEAQSTEKTQATEAQPAVDRPSDVIPVATAAPETPPLPEDWWHKGSDSPVAIAIGSAEGTRQPDGDKNPAYYWHRDPGNGADNFGTFSYQHLPPSKTKTVAQQPSTAAKRQVAAKQGLAEISDQAQLKKLQRMEDQLRQQARSRGIQLSTLELVNGLDLANQSEAAALERLGYIDRLAQSKTQVTDTDEQIHLARTNSYWDPDRDRWNAPGLGGPDDIRRDQERRASEVKAALMAQKIIGYEADP
jgi:hypothetical protein